MNYKSRLKRIMIALSMVVCLAAGIAVKPEALQAASSNKPATPEFKLTAVAGGIKVSVSKTKNADGYRVYYAKKGTDSYKYKGLSKDGTATRSLTIKSLDEGTYSVYVKAYHKVDGKINWSAESKKQTIKVAKAESIVLELNDGTQKTWSIGDEAILKSAKKLKYVYMGSYPQTEVTGRDLTSDITEADYDKNGIATVNGVKYKRLARTEAVYDGTGLANFYNWGYKSYAYFKYEPIKWRVLSAKDDKVLLVSEYVLDCRKYNEEYANVTWEKSSIRTYINDTLMSSAFTKNEKKMVKATTIANNDNITYHTSGGAKTKDSLFLLSYDDMINTSYGFSDKFAEEDVNRRAAATDYTKALGVMVSNYKYRTADGKDSCYWWLRTPGRINCALRIPYAGRIYFDGANVDTNPGIGIRPAFYMDLTSIIK